MSELHWALLAIGAALLVAVYAYGKWQERRTLRRLDGALHDGVHDALMQPPVAAPPAGRAEPGPVGRIEPVLGDTGRLDPADAPAVPDARATAPHRASEWLEDPLLDFAVELRCNHPVDGVTALDACGQLARLGLALPTHFAVWDARAQEWTLPDRFGFYTELLLAVQIADRRGPLSEIDASRFVATLQQIALALDADFDAPDVPRLVAQAWQLDRLCARFDVQITLTLESQSGPWNNDVLAAAAADAAFVAAGPQRWQRLDAHGAPALQMHAGSQLADRLAIVLDVPRVAQALQPMRLLLATANLLAPRLSARIVDDNGRPVDAAALPAIEQQLEALYAEMRGADLEAGSVRARRLYV